MKLNGSASEPIRDAGTRKCCVKITGEETASLPDFFAQLVLNYLLTYLLTHLLTYLLQGADTFLKN